MLIHGIVRCHPECAAILLQIALSDPGVFSFRLERSLFGLNVIHFGQSCSIRSLYSFDMARSYSNRFFAGSYPGSNDLARISLISM